MLAAFVRHFKMLASFRDKRLVNNPCFDNTLQYPIHSYTVRAGLTNYRNNLVSRLWFRCVQQNLKNHPPRPCSFQLHRIKKIVYSFF